MGDEEEATIHVVAPSAIVVAAGTKTNRHVKALRTLVEGRVGVRAVEPGRVEAWVRCTSGHIHRVRWSIDGEWTCDCESERSDCHHVESVAMIVVLPDLVGEGGRG